MLKSLDERMKEFYAAPEKPRKRSRLRRYLMKGVVGVLAAATIGTPIAYFLAKDYATKRQNYPERNVIYRAAEARYLQGASEGKDSSRVDSEAHVTIKHGETKETRIGNILAEYDFVARDDYEEFEGSDANNIRFVHTVQKREIVQGGLRLHGSNSFVEEGSVLGINKTDYRDPDLVTYEFKPERGMSEVEISVRRNPDGTRTLLNKLTENRAKVLGWAWGIRFREGTLLEEYVLRTTDDEAKAIGLMQAIKQYDSQTGSSLAMTQGLQETIKTLAGNISTRVVYRTHEDGIVDVLPQDSTIYLMANPPLGRRITTGLAHGRHHVSDDFVKLRVENYWDLWPGNARVIPIIGNFLADLKIGSGKNTLGIFDKKNNGGYRIVDDIGTLAEIQIKDFILYYGNDILYKYFLDKNGDGRIDQASECVGQVLYRLSQDELMDLEKVAGAKRDKVDVTYSLNYVFMAGSNTAEAKNDFKLCAYIETMMPDQINRGFDLHSSLGYVNRVRGMILLTGDQSIENLTRILNQEGTLRARQDIIELLTAARRPYAQQVARFWEAPSGIRISPALNSIIK